VSKSDDDAGHADDESYHRDATAVAALTKLLAMVDDLSIEVSRMRNLRKMRQKLLADASTSTDGDIVLAIQQISQSSRHSLGERVARSTTLALASVAMEMQAKNASLRSEFNDLKRFVEAMRGKSASQPTDPTSSEKRKVVINIMIGLSQDDGDGGGERRSCMKLTDLMSAANNASTFPGQTEEDDALFCELLMANHRLTLAKESANEPAKGGGNEPANEPSNEPAKEPARSFTRRQQ